jgi:hypothetical protein
VSDTEQSISPSNLFLDATSDSSPMSPQFLEVDERCYYSAKYYYALEPSTGGGSWARLRWKTSRFCSSPRLGWFGSGYCLCIETLAIVEACNFSIPLILEGIMAPRLEALPDDDPSTLDDQRPWMTNAETEDHVVAQGFSFESVPKLRLTVIEDGTDFESPATQAEQRTRPYRSSPPPPPPLEMDRWDWVLFISGIVAWARLVLRMKNLGIEEDVRAKFIASSFVCGVLHMTFVAPFIGHGYCSKFKAWELLTLSSLYLVLFCVMSLRPAFVYEPLLLEPAM